MSQHHHHHYHKKQSGLANVGLGLGVAGLAAGVGVAAMMSPKPVRAAPPTTVVYTSNAPAPAPPTTTTTTTTTTRVYPQAQPQRPPVVQAHIPVVQAQIPVVHATHAVPQQSRLIVHQPSAPPPSYGVSMQAVTSSPQQLQHQHQEAYYKQQYQSQVNCATQQHQAQVNAIKQQHQAQVNAVKQQYQAQVNAVQQKHQLSQQRIQAPPPPSQPQQMPLGAVYHAPDGPLQHHSRVRIQANAGGFVRIKKFGEVDANGKVDGEKSVFVVHRVTQGPTGSVRLQSDMTKTYLCISTHGNVESTPSVSSDTLFELTPHNNLDMATVSFGATMVQGFLGFKHGLPRNARETGMATHGQFTIIPAA